jgi:hypothetical protein
MNKIEEVRLLAQVLAEGDYQKHISNGVDLNPFSTVGARHAWERGFDGDTQKPYESLAYDAEYQRGKAARCVLNTKGELR